MANTIKTANQIKLGFHQQEKAISSWTKANSYNPTLIS